MKKIVIGIIIGLMLFLICSPAFRGGFVDELSQLFKIQQKNMIARKSGVTIGGGTYPINFVGVMNPTRIGTAADPVDSAFITIVNVNTIDADVWEGDLEVTGEITSGFFFQELLQYSIYIQTNSGTNTSFYGGFTTFSSDSFIMDSLRVVWYTSQNDVYIDLIKLERGVTRLAPDATLLMGDGTNIGAGTLTYVPITYIVNQTISFDWRLRIYFEVETSGIAGFGRISSAKAYFSY